MAVPCPPVGFLRGYCSATVGGHIHCCRTASRKEQGNRESIERDREETVERTLPKGTQQHTQARTRTSLPPSPTPPDGHWNNKNESNKRQAWDKATRLPGGWLLRLTTVRHEAGTQADADCDL